VDTHNPYVAVSGLGYLLTSKGVPIIYYGLEQGFSGACPAAIHAGNATVEIQQACAKPSDSTYRQSMFLGAGWRLSSAIASIDAMSFIGPTSPPPAQPYIWQSDAFLNRSHTIYTVAKALAHVRRSCSALVHGNTYYRSASTSQAGMAFSRIYQTSEIVVLVNPSSVDWGVPDGEIVLDASINIAGAVYVDVLDPTGSRNASVTVDGHGARLLIKWLVYAHTSVILVNQRNLRPFDSGLQASLCVS